MNGYFFTRDFATSVQRALSGFCLMAYIWVTRSRTTSLRIGGVSIFFCSSGAALMHVIIVGLHISGITNSLWANADADDAMEVDSSESTGVDTDGGLPKELMAKGLPWGGEARGLANVLCAVTEVTVLLELQPCLETCRMKKVHLQQFSWFV